MKMKLVTIQSRHYEETIRFYEDAVKLSVQGTVGGLGQHTITFLGDGQEGTWLEVIQAEGDEFAAKGISIGFPVENVEEYRRELEEKGYEPTPVISPNPKTKFFFVADPNGLMVQFIEM